jgi:hypothetical protein
MEVRMKEIQSAPACMRRGSCPSQLRRRWCALPWLRMTRVRVVGLTNRLLAFSGALTPRFILRWLMAKMFAPSAAAAPAGRK